MLQCHVAVIVTVSLFHPQKWTGGQVWLGVLHARHRGKRVGALVLQQQDQPIWRFLCQTASFVRWWSSQLFETPLRVPTGVWAPSHHVQFVLQKQPSRLAKASIGNGAKATSAGVLGFAVVLEVHAYVCSSDVHVADAHAATVKVAVFEEIHDRLGKYEGDIETVSLGDGGHSGRLNRAEWSAGRGSGSRRVKVRVVVLERALDAWRAAGRPWSAWCARRGHGEPRCGWGGQDACAAVAGRGTAGHEGCVGLRGVGLTVVWLHTGDVTVTERWTVIEIY